ncbi:MAG TPA: prepilin-type N-terminal cleavage/methylation domain-containing protein [Verrucomicrobiae bacterium]|nr:prepilin-type N-terminal cleavage/methylation domain-containing protein [Verrucomicrobiae bacterium]
MISATGNDGRSSRGGFTLIELSIAVFIIAIIVAVTAPSFVRSYNTEILNATGRTIATSCEFAKLNAVLHQEKVGYFIDMDRQTIWLTQINTNDTADAAGESQVIKSIPIPTRIGLSSAQLGELLPESKGQVQATFYPNGTCDAFAVTLRGVEKGSGLEIVVDPVTCRGMLWPVKL